MIIHTPDVDTSRTERLFEAIQATLEAFRLELDAYKEEARNGEDVTTTTAKAKAVLSNASTLITQCLKLETTLDECRRRQSRIARGGYACDLDAARAQVRCALGRLRACGATGAVSE